MKEKTVDVRRRREELEATIRRAEEQMRNLTFVPIEDVFPDGAMFRVKTRPLGGQVPVFGEGAGGGAGARRWTTDAAGDTDLTYLLLKVENQGEGWWHHTGRRSLSSRGWGNAPMRWSELMAWLLSAAHNVTEWTELVPKLEPVAPEVAESAVKILGEEVELRRHIIAVHGYEVASIMTYDKMVAWHHDHHHNPSYRALAPGHPFDWHGLQISEIRKPMIGTPTPE